MEKAWEPEELVTYLSGHGAAIAPGGVFKASVVARHADPRAALVALQRGEVIRRLRRGWYALPGADRAVVTAVESGGVLSCLSALARFGVWVPPVRAVHARPARPAQVLNGRVHQCTVTLRLPAPVQAVDPVPIALRACAGCLTRDLLTAVTESALDRGLIHEEDLGQLFVNAPGDAARAVRRVAWSQSGTETLVRLGLRRMGLGVRTQVLIDGFARVDLLVGDRLVIEVDSHAHHADPDAYRRDRDRDLRLTALGYLVVRVTWHQAMYEWPRIEAAIRAIVDAGEHRWPKSRVA